MPRDSTTPLNIDPAALVREFRDAERWIDQVHSFRLRADGKWTSPPQAIEHHRAELKKRFPHIDPSPQQFCELRPEWNDALDIAFDDQRAYFGNEGIRGQGTFQRRLWDGKRGVAHENHGNQEFYAFERSAPKLMGMMLGWLPWPRAAPHAFWFTDDPLTERDLGKPHEFELVGREPFRGLDCFVLQAQIRMERMFVGAGEHRLYGQHSLTRPPSADEDDEQIYLDLAKENGLASVDEFDRWREAQPQELKDRLDEQYLRRRAPSAVRYIDKWFEKYEQVAPACWMPMRMGYDIWETKADPPFISTHRELNVVDVSINRPLPDELFAITFCDGVQVYDWGHDPPLYYKYQSDRTPEQWQAIFDEARQRQAAEQVRQAAQDKILGQPAPPFPPGAQWLNSDPLDWEALRGNVVLLDFWAEWCGPCRNDLPSLARLHKQNKSGIIVIGMHTSGSELADIRKIMTQFDIRYPVCIDVPLDRESSWGVMNEALGVSSIPHSLVIDRDGRIAAHGQLSQMLPHAQHLAAQTTAGNA